MLGVVRPVGETSAMLQAVAKVGDPLAFYTVTATIIPVLLLAVVFQSKAIERLGEAAPWLRLGYGVVYFAFATLGEATALHVLAIRHAYSGAEFRTFISLVGLGGSLVGAHLTESMTVMIDRGWKLKIRVLFAIAVTVSLVLILVASLGTEVL